MEKKATAVAAGVLACLLLGAAPARGASAPGTWWTGHQICTNGVNNQVQYQNSEYQTRASGFGTYYGRAYIRQVVLTEYLLNHQQGQRVVNYTGNSHSAVYTAIPSTYLPWMPNYDTHGARADLSSKWSDGAVCTVQFDIGD